jgi:hypothetical protein
LKSSIEEDIMLRKAKIAWALPLLLAGAAYAAGPQDEVAEITVSPGRIHWRTNVQAASWTLTVSGQGIYLRESFEQGKQPTLQSTAPDGERLADGSYNWELRAVQAPSGLSREAMQRDQTQPTRSRAQRGAVEFERRQVSRAAVTSGSLQVLNGAFVMPQPESGDRGGKL